MSQKEIQLVAKLNRLTLDNEISWQVTEPATILTTRTDQEITQCFMTIYKNKKIFLYVQTGLNYFSDLDQWYQTEFPHICIINNNLIEWEFYNNVVISDLLTTVMKKSIDLDNLLAD